jgi:hypothetical protein
VKLVAVFLLAAFACPGAVAGGNATRGLVTAFSGADGDYRFTFQHKGARLVMGCPALEVTVSYARVPWYSWLPGVQSRHPGLAQTVAAAAALQSAFKDKQEIYLGTMGMGLKRSTAGCTFRSKGLELQAGAVYSYHDPL